MSTILKKKWLETKLVVACIDNSGFEKFLTLHKKYAVLDEEYISAYPAEGAPKEHYIKTQDDNKHDRWLFIDRFIPILA